MDAAAKIAIIRDLFLIVSAGMFLIVLLATGYILLRVYRRLYPPLQRTAENLEVSSNIILSLLTHPLNLITTLMDSVNRVVSLIQQLRGRKEVKDEEEEEE